MPEIPRLYINEGCRTEQLREAAFDLVEVDLRVVRECGEKVGNLNPALSRVNLPILLRAALGPEAISAKTDRIWLRAESWLIRMLVASGALSYPDRALNRAWKFMDSSRWLWSRDQALGYLNLTRARLEYLNTVQVQFGLDSIRLGVACFVANGLLRRAIRDGVYGQRAAGC